MVKLIIKCVAYSKRRDFLLHSSIKVRKNSRYDRSIVYCCHPRKIVVLQQQKNFEKWKAKVSYGSRWTAETVFSSLKRTFGEHHHTNTNCRKIDCETDVTQYGRELCNNAVQNCYRVKNHRFRTNIYLILHPKSENLIGNDFLHQLQARKPCHTQ